MEGLLEKRTPSSLFQRWQTRKFVLKDRILCYYNEGSDGQLGERKGIFNFDKAKIQIKIENQKKFRFSLTVKGMSRSFHL